MQKPPSKSPKSSFAKYLMAGSGLAMLVVSGAAYAQEAAVKAGAEDIETVIVVGARASQQSAIDRKKRAKTATDSIVADDIGSFPDRNLNEAISRIAGMGVSRGETGEGESLTFRGNSADLTRVEMDGMSVASSGFGLAVAGEGRASDMRELPADLIKSVDVVKGNTPDMTEGGLGGTVQIQTRSGLDFKKPYLSMRVAGERNSLSEKWSPDINIVASRKFLDGRLGVLFNVSSRRFLGDSHALSNAGSNNAGGYQRTIDLDNSPEKTFAFNPSQVAGADADIPVASWAAATAGQPAFTTLTPRQIVERAAAAKTKAECLSQFPLYTTTELNTISPGTSAANRVAAQQQRINEQLTCLNQWNDYTPNLVRDTNLTQYENRLAWDIRFDYKVNDNFSVYLKYAKADRTQADDRRQRTRGEIQYRYGNSTQAAIDNAAPFLSQTIQVGANGTAYPANTINYLVANNGRGYYLYNAQQPTSSVAVDVNPNAGTGNANVTNQVFPTYGVAASIVPGSIVMDNNHHVVSFQLTDASYGLDHIRNDQIWDTSYVQVGGNYRSGGLKVDFQASKTSSTYSRYDSRVQGVAANYGTARMYALESGNWAFELPTSFNFDDMSNYMPLNQPAGTTAAAQALSARYTNNLTLAYNPRLVEGEETAAKFDATYNMPDVPFLKLFKMGLSYRQILNDSWGGGGFAPKPGVTVPTNTLRSTVRACENQATTSAANACVYGYVPGTGTASRFGQETLTRAQLTSILQNSIEYNSGTFMPGYEGVDGLNLWNSIDVNKLFSQLAAAQNYNFDCFKQCVGSDGVVYNQPFDSSNEEITAAYYMFEFEQPLPLGMEFSGNFGVRAVQSKVAATGYMTINSIRKIFIDDNNPANDWNATNNNNLVTTSTFRQPVSIQREYTDWLPSYNAALWAVPDKVVLRYSWSKAIARPNLRQLFPTGDCTVDERIEDRFDEGEDTLTFGCGTTAIGNPDLKPYQATKNNTSVEWYVNKDTFLSLAYYRQKVRIGGGIVVGATGALFDASTSDPVTGRPLSDFDFGYRTYTNGPGYTMSGWEFATKTALTFLPWKLRYTGVDFNVSTNESKGAGGYTDPITGESLGVAGRPDYFANLAVWYDDGKTNARLTYQARSEVLSCVSSCGGNAANAYGFPTNNPTNFVRLPYNPGEPYYTREYGYLDAKLTHKLKSNIELYLEGRNLLKEADVVIGSTDRGFSDLSETPWTTRYGGRRFTVGMIYKLQ